MHCLLFVHSCLYTEKETKHFLSPRIESASVFLARASRRDIERSKKKSFFVLLVLFLSMNDDEVLQKEKSIQSPYPNHIPFVQGRITKVDKRDISKRSVRVVDNVQAITSERSFIFSFLSFLAVYI